MTAVERQELEAQPVISVRQTVPVKDLVSAQGNAMMQLHQYIQEHGITPEGPPFVRYHTFTESETDIELGVPVKNEEQGADQVVSRKLPAGSAVSTWHMGGHDTLAEAYSRIESWLSQQDAEADGGAWEIYYWVDLTQVPDPASWPNPADWRTEIVQPIR